MKLLLLTLLFASAPIEWNGIKVTHSDKEWLEILGEERFQIMRRKGTQRAYTGKYIYSEGGAHYKCAGCDLTLFNGNDQYNAGNGFLSFKKSATQKNVYFEEDLSLSFKRYEVLCRGCDSHLGHVFNDGHPPKKLRFCINSLAIKRIEIVD